LEVFVIDPPAQVAATDVNADGLPLTLDDLVFCWRVIIGDTLLYPRPPALDTAVFFQDDFSKTISISYPDSLTAAYLSFRGNIVPTVLVPNVGVGYNFDGWETHVIIFPLDQVPAFSPGPLVTYTGYGQMIEAAVADYGVQAIPTSLKAAWTINTKAEIEPDTMWAFWAYAIDPIMATIYLGNIPDDFVLDVTEIETSTVRINDDIVPESMQILPGWPGFNGSVMEITFSASEMVHGYLPFYDTTSHLYAVTGQLTDGTPFLTYGDVFLIGHKSGDVNLDGRVNVADLTFLVNYLFRQGDPPPVMETADVNGDGAVNVADVTALVQLLFG
ncbi:MAG: dockerin type I repeat-containing protein, partial [Candidatus Zixiibacteriota bacterium]